MSFYKWKDKLRNTKESSLKLLIIKGHIEENKLNEGLMDRLILGKKPLSNTNERSNKLLKNERTNWPIWMKGLWSILNERTYWAKQI